MFRWFSRRRHLERTAHNLYGSIVAASRRPELFSAYGVPDTVEGRLELLIAHMFLVLERLGREEENGCAQILVDLFFADMDTSLRELGVGDMAVPKKMRQLASAVNGRWDAYREALATGDGKRFARLVGDAFEPGDASFSSLPLARYLHSMLDELKETPVASLAQGIPAASAAALRATECVCQ